MKFEELKEKIIAAANDHAALLVTGNTIPQEAKKIKKAFKLGGLSSTMFIASKGTYPPNMFPAVGVLLDSYTPELSAYMLCFCFRGQLKGNLMMFFEDIEKIEAMRKELMAHKKESRIDKAAEVIARCLCLMDFESFARGTFRGMVNPSMKERVKAKIYELDHEVAQSLTQ